MKAVVRSPETRDAAKVSGYAEGAIFFQYQLRENTAEGKHLRDGIFIGI